MTEQKVFCDFRPSFQHVFIPMYDSERPNRVVSVSSVTLAKSIVFHERFERRSRANLECFFVTCSLLICFVVGMKIAKQQRENMKTLIDNIYQMGKEEAEVGRRMDKTKHTRIRNANAHSRIHAHNTHTKTHSHT